MTGKRTERFEPHGDLPYEQHLAAEVLVWKTDGELPSVDEAIAAVPRPDRNFMGGGRGRPA